MINNLQVIRAFAALNVVLFHALGTASASGYNTKFLSLFVGWGANGVDLFFVVSGFIMVVIQTEKPKSASQFIKNRLIRIAPLYATVTISLFIVTSLALHKSALYQYDWMHLFTSLLFSSNIFEYPYPIIGQGWTLELEIVFYSIFALCILLSRFDTAILTALILSVLTLFNMIETIAIEFIFGMIVGKLYLNGHFKKCYKACFVLGCIALALSLFIKLNVNRVIIWGVPSALIVLSCCYLPQVQNKFLLMIGNASYSIYLSHAVIVSLFFKLIALVKLGGFHPDIYITVSFVLSVILGSMLYIFFEKPVTTFLKMHNS